jgi:hypothetical protein
MHIKPITYPQQHWYVLRKNLTPLRDPNPGLLFLRKIRCPQIMHIEPIANVHTQHSYVPRKNVIPGRDTNPGLLFLRQMRTQVFCSWGEPRSSVPEADAMSTTTRRHRAHLPNIHSTITYIHNDLLFPQSDSNLRPDVSFLHEFCSPVWKFHIRFWNRNKILYPAYKI